MENNHQFPSKSSVIEYLDRHLGFQRRWRKLTMTFYVLTTFTTVACSTIATIISAYHSDLWASIFAAVATVLIGVDRSLLFREKWKLHVSIAISLDSVKAALVTDQIDIKTAVQDMRSILDRYANELPFPLRD